MMNKVKLILAAAVLSMSLVSCGKSLCVRCENGVLNDVDTECFTDKNERESFIKTREALGYTCTGD